mmetsp:Transcript_43347/g.99316  ORF Transcript_43347/g.99316 Transcript_43347/m.99316 type:complete len:258 (-) Transcript_43347:129-902(-)
MDEEEILLRLNHAHAKPSCPFVPGSIPLCASCTRVSRLCASSEVARCKGARDARCVGSTPCRLGFDVVQHGLHTRLNHFVSHGVLHLVRALLQRLELLSKVRGDQVRVVRHLFGHLAYHLDHWREGEGGVSGLRLHLQDGHVLRALERVELPVEVAPREARERLAHGAAQRVGLLEQDEILARAQVALDHRGRLRAVVLRLRHPQLVLEGHVRPLLAAADAAALVLIHVREVRLLDLEDLQRLHVLAQLLSGGHALE